MSPEDIIKRIASSEEIIELATTPGRAFIIISQLQLALRHPGNTGPTAEMAREIIANIAQEIAAATFTPEVLQLVAMGSHPEFDMTDEEADAHFGLPRALTLSLDLKKDCDPDAVGQALAMLMKQTTNPEKTLAQWEELLTRIKLAKQGS